MIATLSASTDTKQFWTKASRNYGRNSSTAICFQINSCELFKRFRLSGMLRSDGASGNRIANRHKSSQQPHGSKAEKENEIRASGHDVSPLGDHRLHRVRNEDPSDGKAENCAGQAGDQDVKGAGVRLGCHSRSSDSSAQANLEHGRILERLLNSRCEICHATEGPFQACCFRASPSESTFS
jgi:hypothetical protein